MSEQPPPGEAGWVFKEIKIMPAERPRAWRSISFLTYATTAAAGLKMVALLLQFVALLGQWRLLSRMADHAFASQDSMYSAAQASDGLVATAGLLFLLALLASYIFAGFWIYNAACNVRALGATGMQNSPGWAVGWYAVPIASWFKPFQAMEEIYQASASPIGWRRLTTPLLLRFWWGGWLAVNIGGSVMFALSRSSDIAGLVGLTTFQLVDTVVDFFASALFLMVVWRIYRAQVHSQSQVGQVAQVFA